MLANYLQALFLFSRPFFGFDVMLFILYNVLMKIEKCINYLLTQTQIKVNQKFRENLSACRVTPAQYFMLYYLWEEDGLSPTQLANFSGLDTSTVTGLLTRLEEKNFITRKNSTDDRRSVNVYLTKSGLALKDSIDPIIKKSNNDVLSGFSEKEKAFLENSLLRILEICN